MVLRGTRCLSVPLKVNQTLHVSPSSDKKILWESINEEGDVWFSAQFSNNLEIIETSDTHKAIVIQKILRLIENLQPQHSIGGNQFKLNLEFNKQYGFGSSSTLISLMSQWSGVDPYYLLENTFGGSGFDVATATARQPIIYSVKNRVEKTFQLPQIITSHLLFVYLGEKQISSKEIALFKSKVTTLQQIERMNGIVDQAVQCKQIDDWERLMEESEALLSSILGIETVKAQYFSDYPYAIKSMGAWGGDFIMATCRDLHKAKEYFYSKGKTPVFTYDELVK